MLFAVPQITMLIFAVFSGFEECNFSFPFRNSNVVFDKKTYNDKAHKFGALGVSVVACGMALNSALNYFPNTLDALAVYGLQCLLYLFIYWLVFDITYSLCIGKEWDYLGTTAKMDVWLQKIGIKNVGRWKAFFCLDAIAGLNYLTSLI